MELCEKWNGVGNKEKEKDWREKLGYYLMFRILY